MIEQATIGHNNPPSDIEIVKERLKDHEAQLRKDMKFIPAPEVIQDEQEAGKITDAIKSVKGFIKKVTDIHKTVKEPYLKCGKAVDLWKTTMESELSKFEAGYAKPLNVFLNKKAQEERDRQLEAARVERERAEALALEAQVHADAGINDTADALLNEAVSAEIMASRMEDKGYTATPSQLARTRSVGGSTASQKMVWYGEIINITAIDLNDLRKYFTVDAIQKAINSAVSDGVRDIKGVKIDQMAKLNIR